MNIIRGLWPSLLRSSRIFSQHGSRMLVRQNIIITAGRRVVINGIIIKRINGQTRPKLPEGVVGHTAALKDCLLPRCADLRVVRLIGRAVLFEDDWLAGCFAGCVVLQDPFIAPSVVVAPLIGIEVESAVVNGGDREVLDEVNALWRPLVMCLRYACDCLKNDLP